MAALLLLTVVDPTQVTVQCFQASNGERLGDLPSRSEAHARRVIAREPVALHCDLSEPFLKPRVTCVERLWALEAISQDVSSESLTQR